MSGARARPGDDGAAADAALAQALWVTVLMGVSFAMIWSSAFSAAKVVVTHAPPFTISALRFLAAAAIAGAAAWALGQRAPRGREAWRAIVVLGICQNTLYLGLYFTAMTKIPAGLAAIVASTMPLLVASFAQAFGLERVGAAKVAGLAVGFGGVVFIMAARVAGGVDLFALGLAVAGVVALAVATLTIRRAAAQEGGLLMVVAAQMLVGAIGCLPVALLFEDVAAIDPAPIAVWAFLYQVFVAGILATVLWFALVRRVSAANASAFHFLNPVFGVAFAALLLGEPLSWRDGAGAALIALGILIVNRAGRARAPA